MYGLIGPWLQHEPGNELFVFAAQKSGFAFEYRVRQKIGEDDQDLNSRSRPNIFIHGGSHYYGKKAAPDIPPFYPGWFAIHIFCQHFFNGRIFQVFREGFR